MAEMMLPARYDSFVTPDIGRIPRTALPPGTLVVVFSPLLDPNAFSALTDLRQRGFPLIVVDTLRDEPPDPGRRRRAGLALRRGAWTAWRPARRCRTSAYPSCPGPQAPNSTACSLPPQPPAGVRRP